MNDSPDALNANTPDAALQAGLRAYFASESNEPPDPEQFWQRLAPRLEPRAMPAATAVAEHPASSRLDEHYLEHLDGDEQPPAHIAQANRYGRRSRRLRRTISTFASLAAVVLISLAAVALFSQFGPGAQTGKTIRSGLLVWHQVTLPQGVVLQEGAGVIETSGGHQPAAQPTTTPAPNAIYAVAPNNGNIAYICEMPVQATPRLWLTLNAGGAWSRLPDLPTSNTAFTVCEVQIDANDARTVVVTLGIGADGASGSIARYLLLDGASQWQPLNQGVNEFASSHGVFFATRNEESQNALLGHLYISTDQMHTWRAIDAALIAENLVAAKRLKMDGATGVEYVWAHPVTGELLAQTYDGVLWRSGDSGSTWSQIELPSLSPTINLTPTPGEGVVETGEPGAALVYVQQPIANGAFTLCALVLGQKLTVLNAAPLYCSVDSGKNWELRPRTTVALGNGKPDKFELPNAMLSDGSLLTWDVRTISMMAGFEPELQAGHILGAIPTPFDPNNIPGGEFGVTTDGAVFWQPQDMQTLYVAVYTYSSDPALSA